MLFIDRVTAFDGTTIEAETVADPDWPLFAGHFPGRPILPGVILIEMTAQAGALIGALGDHVEPGRFLAFAGVEKAKFRQPVAPGDLVRLTVTLERQRRGYFRFSGQAHVGTTLAAETHFTATSLDLDI